MARTKCSKAGASEMRAEAECRSESTREPVPPQPPPGHNKATTQCPAKAMIGISIFLSFHHCHNFCNTLSTVASFLEGEWDCAEIGTVEVESDVWIFAVGYSVLRDKMATNCSVQLPKPGLCACDRQTGSLSVPRWTGSVAVLDGCRGGVVGC